MLTIVLVQGAFADASSWSEVIGGVAERGPGATRDKAAGTDVVRAHAKRAGATVVEVEASHLVMLSQPEAVTDVILKAARAVAEPAEAGKLH